ncbi:MAG: histidinol-phosphatase [bacterium]|jgi:hypothetical protein|nr:histidinol-phosphatase [bacterium]
MKHVRIFFSIFVFICTVGMPISFSQPTSWSVVSSAKQEVPFPDIPGYQTLKCDLHSHTVFSDGLVWPTVRVEVAWREDLDVLVISDHIEYQPHREDIPTNLNRSYQLASGSAASKNILMPRGTEITRDTPPGHFNAIFLEDIEPVSTELFIDSIEAANKQGAFVFWNHQAWQGEERGKWLDVHTEINEKGWLHGMEVCNGDEYYPTAHQWCLEKNFTMLGNSDIHQPSLLTESTPEKHRTVTLVFVKDRTLAALKEALFAGRTAVWYKNQLIGRKEYLEPLFANSIEISAPYISTPDTNCYEITNKTAID